YYQRTIPIFVARKTLVANAILLHTIAFRCSLIIRTSSTYTSIHIHSVLIYMSNSPTNYLVKLIFRWLLTILSFSLAIIVCELILRLLNYQPMHQATVRPFNCYMPGTYYWITLQRNEKCLIGSTDPGFTPMTIQTNSLGLRNPEISIPKPADSIRI